MRGAAFGELAAGAPGPTVLVAPAAELSRASAHGDNTRNCTVPPEDPWRALSLEERPPVWAGGVFKTLKC